MELRDEFAAAAIAGFLAHGAIAHAVQQAQAEIGTDGTPETVTDEAIRKVVRGAYLVADAMLVARED